MKWAYHPEIEAIPPPFSNFRVLDSENLGIDIVGVVEAMEKREIVRNKIYLLEQQ